MNSRNNLFLYPTPRTTIVIVNENNSRHHSNVRDPPDNTVVLRASTVPSLIKHIVITRSPDSHRFLSYQHDNPFTMKRSAEVSRRIATVFLRRTHDTEPRRRYDRRALNARQLLLLVPSKTRHGLPVNRSRPIVMRIIVLCSPLNFIASRGKLTYFPHATIVWRGDVSRLILNGYETQLTRKTNTGYAFVRPEITHLHVLSFHGETFTDSAAPTVRPTSLERAA